MNQNRNDTTRALAKEAVRNATDLVEAELSAAKEELKADAKEAAGAGVFLVGAGLAAFFGVELLILGLAGVSRHPARTAAFGLTLLGGAAIAAGMGLNALPKNPLGRTQARIANDVDAVREELGGPSTR